MKTLRCHSRAMVRARRGFTLLEMMMVVVLIGILAGVAVISLSGVGVTARMDTAKSQLRQLKNALMVYNAREGVFPETLEQLTLPPPVIEKGGLRDPWKQAFVYKPVPVAGDASQPFELICLAGKPAGSPESISVWNLDDAAPRAANSAPARPTAP